MRLKLKYDKLLSIFAFNFNLRRFIPIVKNVSVAFPAAAFSSDTTIFVGDGNSTEIGAYSTRVARLQDLRSDLIMLQPYGTVLGAATVGWCRLQPIFAHME
jgi:hypothetical protein